MKNFLYKNRNIASTKNFLEKEGLIIFKKIAKASDIENVYKSLFFLYNKYSNKRMAKYNRKDLLNLLTLSQYIYDHININYLSNLIVIQKIIPYMSVKKFGRILLSSSTGIKFGGGKLTGLYSLTKYMNEFFFNNYKDFYKKNILINALRIGVTNTKIHKNVKGKNLKKRVNLIPIGRMASTDEVAKYIYFYSSEINSLTTNEIIDISGGEK